MVKEGVYLEEKQGTVGTGNTAKPIVYRNLWATREIKENKVVLQLLDDKANPTDHSEEVGLEELAQRFTHRPLKEESWAALKAKLAAVQPPRPVSRPAPARKKSPPPVNSKNWWDT